MNVLLTGSTGMLGRAFLRTAGPELSVTAMVRHSHQIADLKQSISAESNTRYVVAELGAEAPLNEACRDIDVVVHSAALSSPWGRRKDFQSVNVEGTENLLRAAEKQGVKHFIFISSPSIYFAFENATQITEQQKLPKQFCNDYAHSKAVAESVVQQSAIKTTILRPRGIFGPNDRAIVPRLLAAISRHQLVLPSARNPLVDMTYVDNCALSIVNAIHAEGSQGIFNITNGQPMQLLTMLGLLLDEVAPDTKIKTLPYGLMSRVASVAEFCCGALPHHPEPRLTRYSAGLFHYDQTLCIDNAIERLGYQPAVSIEEGIHRYAQWYRAHEG